MEDDNKDGNLIKGCTYTGVIYIITGIIACLAIGPCLIGLRRKWPCLGTILYDVLTGICGKLLLFLMFWISFISNLLGFFWLYMAGLARGAQDTSEGDFQYGGKNYCAPDVWYFSHFIVYSFFVVTVFLVIRVGAKIFSFFRGDEDDIEVIELGEKVVEMPKRRFGI